MGNSGFKFSKEAQIGLPRKKTFLYVATIIVLILVFTHFTEFTKIGNLFKESNAVWLLAVVLVQLASYSFLALNYRDILRIKETEIKTKELFPLTYIIQFINQTVPSGGLAGQAFFINYLFKKGLSFAEGIGRAILELLTLYLAFGILFLLTILFVFKEHILSNKPGLWPFIYGFLFFAILALGIFFTAQKKSRMKWLERIVFKLHGYFEEGPILSKIPVLKHLVNHKEHISPMMDELHLAVNLEELKRHYAPFWWATFWQIMILIANVFTVQFIGFALGYKLSLLVCLVSFMLTRFIILISVVPGALGISEGTMTFALATFGLPVGVAFSITILFRAFTFWFPMPIGWLLYAKSTRTEEKK